MGERITNAVLYREIINLKEYVKERNDKQDIVIEQNRVASNKNALSIAGMKGASGVIAIVVTFVMNFFINYIFKGLHQ